MSIVPSQPNASVAGGVEILIVLSGAGEALSSGEVARRAEIQPVRANRLLKTLAMIGMVYQRADRKYEPGPGLHVLAAQALFGSGLLRAAMEPIRSLRSGRDIVALGVLWRGNVAYQYHGRSDEPIEEGIGKMTFYPALQSSIGQALLAEMSEDEVQARLTDAEFEGIRERLEQTRQSGVAVAHPAGVRGDTSIAVACGRPRSVGLAVSGKFSPRDVPTQIEKLCAARDVFETRWLSSTDAPDKISRKSNSTH